MCSKAPMRIMLEKRGRQEIGERNLAILDAPKKSRSGTGKEYRVLFSLFLQVSLLVFSSTSLQSEKKAERDKEKAARSQENKRFALRFGSKRN